MYQIIYFGSEQKRSKTLSKRDVNEGEKSKTEILKPKNK